jgi:catechol 2,3-dioxygenase-like lactoylglutathione lyase family enzyme
MIHVPDVKKTVEWYTELGFTVVQTYPDGGDGFSFAIMSFGSGNVMFNGGGNPDTSRRREVDLYVYTDEVEKIFAALKAEIEVVEPLHDTDYGMREFIIRDINRFWMTFGRDL